LVEAFIATPGTAVCYRMRVRRVWSAALAVVCTATTVRLHATPAAPPQQPTFTKDIAPLVWSRCAGCHRPGEIGPFSLVTYDDVKRHASQIAGVTARGIMPPWKPEPGKGDFASARRLTDAEVRLIQEWVDAGAAEGAPSDLPSPPAWNNGWQLGIPDLVVAMPEAYSVRADGGDVFRTFVIPIPTTRERYVRAVEFKPGNARVVHHAVLGVDRTRASRQRDAQDPEPGYVGGMVLDARYPEGQLLGWTPGQAAHPVPSGMQWRLEPSSDLVVQLHLQPTGKPESLKASVAFYFTDEPPSRTPLGLRLGSETIDIPPGDSQYIVEDRYVLPADVEVLAVQPHAHYLARRMEATATRPDGSVEWLIAIADWDFRWQDVYRYATPLALSKGTMIAMRYTYDNSADNPRNPSHPPARVVWGENTSDEMGDLWLQLIPRSPSDLAALSQDIRRKTLGEDLAAYTQVLRRDPNNALRHDAVAGVSFEAGQVDVAIEQYIQSLQLNPSSASTHYNLGIALSARGRREEALAHLEQAVRLDPDYAAAHNNLGALLQLAGRVPEALEHYRRAVALRPDALDARTNLATLLSATGRPQEAADEFHRVLALRADHPAALSGLAWIRATSPEPGLKNADEAVRLAERAAALTARRDVSVLDALAAAYAAAGRFDEAVAAARNGTRLAISAGLTEVASRLGERLALYQQHRPYVMVR
jgi:tetratricopeptide (TPR) repeat protein